MATNIKAAKPAETYEETYEDFVALVRSAFNGLALATVLYDRELKEMAAMDAHTWAVMMRGDSPTLGDRCVDRAELARAAKSVRAALCTIAPIIEENFAIPRIVAQFSPDLMPCIFDERAICSKLWSSGYLRAASDEGWIENHPLPSPQEIDELLAHGLKLYVLLARSAVSQ